MPERIMLLFGGSAEDEEQMDSGFGPFGLCRLAYETGGLYFTVHPNRKTGKKVEPWETAAMSSHISKFFDERVMRNYRPEYVPARQYLRAAEVEQGLRGAGRGVAAVGDDADGKRAAAIPANRRRPVRPRPFERPARGGQARAEDRGTCQPFCGKASAIATRSRRRAGKPGYDLAIGRALAVKVRTEGYNAMLADAKQGLKFKDEKNDTWELRPTDSVTVSSALAKDAEDAKKYLKRVVADHKGTPWAVDAEKELKQPFGWEWHETFHRRCRPHGPGRSEPAKSPATGAARAAAKAAPRSAAAVARSRVAEFARVRLARTREFSCESAAITDSPSHPSRNASFGSWR